MGPAVASWMLQPKSWKLLPSNSSLLWCRGKGDIPDTEEEMETQSDCHRFLKLLFIFPHKLFTFYSYFCVFSRSIYKAQHSEFWAEDLDFCAAWLWHLITCPGYLETYFSLNSCGSLATCNQYMLKGPNWEFLDAGQGKTEENLDISAEAFFGLVGF